MAVQTFQPATQPAVNRQIYDSGIVYAARYPLAVTPEIINALHIPSSRYFYPSLDGRSYIPHIALPIVGIEMDPDQMRRDVAAWKADPPGRTIYILETVDGDDPQLDLYNIIEGRRVIVPPERLDRYLRELGATLDQLRTLRAQDRFALIPGRRLMELMLNYPFNRAANYIRASQIAAAPTIQEIQAYLNERGIFHFRAEDIVGLPSEDIFFYLTRFYGPPVEGNLESKVYERLYLKQANNETTRNLARLIPNNLQAFQSYRNEFNLVFEELNQDPNSPHIERVFDTNSRERFLQEPFAYLTLLRRSNNLPQLTLNTIRQLIPGGRSQIIDLLRNYSDREIILLVGTIIQDEPTRTALLHRAVDELTTSRVFLLTPIEAALCKNKESVTTGNEFRELNTAYLGRGSFAAGFDCYEIEDLFSSFEAHKDQSGIYTFVDPLNLNNRFSIQDLIDFRNAIQTGRAGIPSSPQLVARFNTYITAAESQSRSDFQQIQRLRQWANQSSQNKEIIRNLFLNYFYMGMYMRQWKGPGNPYPITKNQTGSEAEAASNLGLQIAENVERQKVIVEQYLAQLPADLQDIFWNLRVYFLQGDRLTDKGTNIQTRWVEVLTGTFCIRMASGPWAFTGAYYLKQILNEEIPGFDLGQGLDYIY
jgi:hypothetical protein